MGKKKKKAGGGAATGAPTKTKAKKKDPEPEITLSEALIAFQVKVKERSIEEFSEDVDEWQFKNDRLRERNKKMKAEQLEHIKRLLQQAKERDRVLYESTTTVDREQVEAAKVELVQAGKQAERNVEDLHAAVSNCDDLLQVTRAEVERLKAYRDVGQHVARSEIEGYRKQLAEYDAEYDELRESLDAQKAASRQAFSCQIEDAIAQQRHTASDMAVAELDTKSHMEVHYQVQLRTEVAELYELVSNLERDIQHIEEENLKLISEMWTIQQASYKNPTRRSLDQTRQFIADDITQDERLPEAYQGDDFEEDAELVAREEDSLHILGKSVLIHLSPEKTDTPLRLPPLPPCSSLTHESTAPALQRSTSDAVSSDQSWPVTYDMLKSVVGMPIQS